MDVVIALSEPAAVALAFVVGLCVGSFLIVVVHRLPRMLERDWRAQCAELAGDIAPAAEPAYNLVVPRSACPACGHAIGAHENIPVLSWLALRGKCSACKAPISARYPLVEHDNNKLAALAVAKFGLTASGIAAALFLWALLALTFIDFDTQLLPDDITLPLLWAGLSASALHWTPLPLTQAVWGAVAGYLSLWLIYHAFKLLTGKEGMGYGDIK